MSLRRSAVLLVFAMLLSVQIGGPAEAVGAQAPAIPGNRGTDPEILDDVFIFPDGGHKFDATTWKSNPECRFSMLFDLYHLPLNTMTVDQIVHLLGLPGESRGDRTDRQLLYDLGLQKGLPTSLSIYFREGKLECLGLEQTRKEKFPQQDLYPKWQVENLHWDTLADEYNRKYFIVGMPVKLISTALGYWNTGQGSTDASHRFGPFELEYTPDNSRVKRFRIGYDSTPGSLLFTEWADKDLRKDSRCLVRESEYFNLQFRQEPLLEPLTPFTKHDWRSNEPRDFNRRNSMICGLVRSYPIIGMSRSGVQRLLGESTAQVQKKCLPSYPFRRHSEEEQKKDPLCADTQDYQLYLPGRGYVGVNFFEVSFKDNRVVAYRVIYAGGEHEVQIVSGDAFGFGP